MSAPRARSARIAVLLPFLLSLSGCSPPPIDLTVQAVGGKLSVKLSQDWGIIFADRKAPCIRDISLNPESDYSRPIWRAEARGGVQCLDLAGFTVGVAPDRFEQTIALPGTTKGRYQLQVNGIGWGELPVTL